MFRVITSVLFIFISQMAFGFPNLDFDGSFSAEKISGPECQDIFKKREYVSHFRVVGPTKRTAVLNFAKSGGFFDGQTLVGLLGPSNDFKVEKSFDTNGKKYEIIAEGIVDFSFITANVAVNVSSLENYQLICQAQAEYSSF